MMRVGQSASYLIKTYRSDALHKSFAVRVIVIARVLTVIGIVLNEFNIVMGIILYISFC